MSQPKPTGGAISAMVRTMLHAGGHIVEVRRRFHKIDTSSKTLVLNEKRIHVPECVWMNLKPEMVLHGENLIGRMWGIRQ